MALTEKEKDSQKRYYYSNKPMQFGVIFKTDADKIEGLRLQAYLSQTGISANAYIKSLIRADLDSKNVPYPPEK